MNGWRYCVLCMVVLGWLAYSPAQTPTTGPTPALNLSDTEKAWLQTHPVIRVGADAAWAPVMFRRTPTALPQGLAAEYLQAAIRTLGLKVEYVPNKPWAELQAMAQRKQLDVLPSTAETPERRQFLTFTEPYISIPIVIFTRSDVAYVPDLNALHGKTVAIVKGYAPAEWLTRDHPQILQHQVPTVRDGLELLETGRVDALVDGILTASYYIDQLKATTIKVSGETPYAFQLRMGVRNDWPELATLLQKAINAIPRSEQDEIYQHWIAIRYEHRTNYTVVWQILGAALVLIGIVVVWNRRLRAEIARRLLAEQQLKQQQDTLERTVAERTALLARQAEELRVAHADVQAASTAKDRFIATLSHELRTPLTPVLLSLSEMEQDPATPVPCRPRIALMRRNVEIEVRLIDDLLQMALITRGRVSLHRRHLDAHEPLRQCLQLLDADARAKRIRLTLQEEASYATVFADPTRLQQICWNLLRNAIKFTPADGFVTVTTRNPAPTTLEVEVQDSGIGMDDATLQEVFDAFAQASAEISRQYGGLGLGLSIAKSLAEAHGGSISATSDGPNLGSRFTLRLPLASKSEQTSGHPGSRSPAERSASSVPCRTLIVEDHMLTATMLGQLLRKKGFTVTTAHSVAEATKAIDQALPELLVCDIGLPDGTGLSVIRYLRERSSVPAIAFSGYGTAADVQASLDAGFTAHLTKPVQFQQLLDAIASMQLDQDDKPAALVEQNAE